MTAALNQTIVCSNGGSTYCIRSSILMKFEPFAGEPLKRLTDRRAAEPHGLRQDLLGEEFTRGQKQRRDHLLEPCIGEVGQRRRLDGRIGYGIWGDL